VLKVALSEYESSIEDGKFAKPVEYQDSRGFLQEAEWMLEGSAADLRKADADAFAKVQAALQQLKTAWPKPMPPETPLMDVGTMSALVSRSSCIPRGIDGAGRTATGCACRRRRARSRRDAGFRPHRRRCCVVATAARNRRRDAAGPTHPGRSQAHLRPPDLRAGAGRQSCDAGQARPRPAPVRGQALSVTGTIACVSCHDPKLAFTDGESTGRGVSGRPLVRHTPSLWNVAWSPLLMWDGRADSLEDQIRLPLTHPDEMGATFQHAVERPVRRPRLHPRLHRGFPASPGITSETIAKALAAFERSLVSPPTRFDQWIGRR
jgi:hypothetical protein